MLRTLLHVPTLCYLSGSSPSNYSSNLSCPSMATSAGIAVGGDIVSSLSVICFYMNLETLALCEMTVFFSFLNENLWVLKHNDWNLQVYLSHYSFYFEKYTYFFL